MRAIQVARVVFVQVRVDCEDRLDVLGIRVPHQNGEVLGISAIPAVAPEIDPRGRVRHDVFPLVAVPTHGRGRAEGWEGCHFCGAVAVEEFDARGDGVAVGLSNVAAGVEDVLEVLAGEVEQGWRLGDFVDDAGGKEGDVGAGMLDAADKVFVEEVG